MKQASLAENCSRPATWGGVAKAGQDTPISVDLELDKYLDGRGKKKLNFNKKVEFKDPYGIQDKL